MHVLGRPARLRGQRLRSCSRACSPVEASFERATVRARRKTDHRWVCSGFTSIAEVGEQCPAQELHCGRGRSEAAAPSRSPGYPGFTVNGTAAEAPQRFRRRPRTLVADGRCSFVRVARVHRSRGVLGQSAWGLVESRRRKAGLLRDPGAPEACRKRAAPEKKAGAASPQRVEVGEAT